MSALEILAAIGLAIVAATLLWIFFLKKPEPESQVSESDIRIKAMQDIVEYLPSAAMIVDAQDFVIANNTNCIPLRLIADERVAIPEIRKLNNLVSQNKTLLL